MPRYFAEISYNGTAYHGWQIQDNANTVQQKIDDCFSLYLRQKIETLGCGRTDTGVHAQQFFLHFDSEIELENLEQTVYKLNKILPKDIAIHDLFNVADDAHARFAATSRTYEYHILQHKNVFIENAFIVQGNLNVAKMNEAAKELFNYIDFSCFSKSNTQVFTNNCKIMHAAFTQSETGIVFTIKADRFLRNMVRAIVGTLLEIGKEKITIDDLKKIIEGKNRSKAGASVPACGLFLTRVEYPETIKKKE